MHEETSILNDTTFWYAVAALIFVVLIFWKARGAITGWLDGEIQKVRDELAEAKRLREEAEATLAEYRVHQSNAMKEAEEIVMTAKADADRLRQDAQDSLKASLARHEAMAIERINLLQEEAKQEVREFFISEAMLEVRGKLGKMTGTAEGAALSDKVIASLPGLTKNKVA